MRYTQMTYRELRDRIQAMSETELDMPVKMYCSLDEELHPKNDSTHPDYGYSSYLATMEDVDKEYDLNELTDPDQLPIVEYMHSAGERACLLQHHNNTLNDPDSTEAQKEWARMRIYELT